MEEKFKYQVGDLVCERHQNQWLGIVVDHYDKNLGTDYEEQLLVVDWINNSNNTGTSSREQISSSYVELVKRG